MYSSGSTSIVVIVVVFITLATFVVGLRVRARGSVKSGLAADDYVIAVALLTHWAATAMTIFGAVAGGEGDSLKNLSRHPEEGKRYARLLFAGPFVFAITIALIKVSTLLLYKRLFITPRFHQACNVMFGLTTAWFLTSVF
ncbi:MAG: hypothetical protein L6R39_007340, partial [Caloplaca ligustica]